MFLDKVAMFIVKRKLQKSGQLNQLERSFKARAASRYDEFEDFFYEITASLDYSPLEQQQFFFDFQIILLSSIWSSMNREETEKIKLLAMNYYKSSMSDVMMRIESLHEQIPNVALNEKSKVQIESYIELLSDSYKAFDADDYTFREAISMIPENLSYPEDLALKILTHMGYTRK